MKSSSQTQLSVPLSYLVPSRRNPRKVRPSRQSHESLVALIRSLGLLQPLVVRPAEGKPKHYEVVAGGRRLRALREIHKDDGDPKVRPAVRRLGTFWAIGSRWADASNIEHVVGCSLWNDRRLRLRRLEPAVEWVFACDYFFCVPA